jgi:hypothetical protein
MLTNADGEIARDPEQADIIIAHSAGCYMLPETTRAHLILLIGLPLWSNKSLLLRTREKIKGEPKNSWWYRKMSHNIYSLFSHPLLWLRMKRAYDRRTFPSYEQDPVILLLHNSNDTYMNAVESQQLALQKGWIFQDIEGLHDDLWVNPKKYLDLINEYFPAS